MMKLNLFLFFIISIHTLAYSQEAPSSNEPLQSSLQIAVYDSPPFGFAYEDGEIGGLMVEIWQSIAEDLDWSYDFHLTDMDGLLNGLQSGQYDLALGAISITPKREKLVDFTHAVNPSGTGVAVAAHSSKSSFLKYWKPLLISLLELIGSLLIVLLISGTIVWWVEKRHNHHKQSEKNISRFADGLWWSAVTMTTVGYGDKVPNSNIGKILGIVWIFTSIILLSLFTANASAILNNSTTESFIDSEEDLRRHVVGAAHKSSGEEFLIREHIPYQSFPNVEAAIDAMLKGDIDCVVSNVPVLKYLNNSSYFEELIISSKLLLKNNMGIALPEESPIKETIDLILLEKISEARWQEAVYKYLGEE